MADFLTAIKSVRTQSTNENGDSLLTAVQSKDNRTKESKPQQPQHQTDDVKISPPADSPEEALRTLRSQPDIDQLSTIIRQLNSSETNFPGFEPNFSLHSPGPLQAQIIQVLLNTTVPHFWHVLSEQQRQHLISSFRNVAGFNAVISRLKLLSSQRDQNDEHAGQGIVDLLDVAERQFTGSNTILNARQHLQTAVEDAAKREMSWKEFVNLLGSGKIIATVAQAEDAVKGLYKSCWLAKGAEYAAWLGKNVGSMGAPIDSSQKQIAGAAQVFAKALNIGYPSQLLHGLFARLAPSRTQAQAPPGTSVLALMEQLPAHTKRTLTEHLLRWLSSMASETNEDGTQNSEEVSAMAASIFTLIQDGTLKRCILSFLEDPALSSSVSFSIHRACLAALSQQNEEDIESLLDRTMSTFSDPLFINHSPILQQESSARIVLLSAGYLHRKNPMALLVVARSSSHMQGVSNRLDSSNQRARWLGMVVGVAVSSLVDKEESKMTFGTEEMNTEEAARYIELTKVKDIVGTWRDFATLLETLGTTSKATKTLRLHKNAESIRELNGKPVFGPPRPPVQTEVVGEKVTEILDEESDEEDDLKPYAKPDSDPEDSDEDATLVNRNKVRPPVYIRDLMSMLRDDQKHDRFQAGIKHAAALIRRKSTFGAEVKDHAEELAAILCNLQDPFETENFDESKLQALIAVLLSDVNTIAPWLSRQAFSGDYSVAQRCLMLSALGLGGRELAGLKNDDELNPKLENTEFPSKRLPPHLHSTYNAPSSTIKRLEAASKKMEQAMIKPLALHAADQSTAHLNAVKVRKFSSRMDVERTKREPAPNQLAKIFGEAFFFPLTHRYQQEIASYSSASVFSAVPVVLVTFLKTLALLLHASGPATLSLLLICAELWDLLLSLRVQAVSDITVLQAVLFALLTLLEVNGDKKRIAEECPKQLIETQQWVDLIFERTGGGNLISEGGNDDEVKVRTLAAAVLVKTREIIEAYQRQLIGYEFD